MIVPDQFNYRELVVSRIPAQGLLNSQCTVVQVRTLLNFPLRQNCQQIEFCTAQAAGFVFIYLFINSFIFGLKGFCIIQSMCLKTVGFIP
jgi:hypothetical protein